MNLGGGAHPVERFDVFVHGLFNGEGHFQGVLLCFRRKVLGHVDLAEGFAHLAIDAAGAALPTFLLFFGAVENVRVEVPGLGFEGLWHAGSRVGMKQVPAQVGTDLVERGVGEERVEFGKELRLHVIGFAGGRSVSRFDIIAQIEMREHFRHRGDVSGVVQVLRVATFRDGERCLGETGFDGHYGVGIF